MRHLLITGGFGYVGGRLAQYLASMPDTRVTLGSRQRQPAPAWLPQASVASMAWQDTAALADACSGVDMLVHCAAMNETDAARDPVAALEVNAVATARLLQAAQLAGVTRFLYFSTAHVYGAPLAGRLDEDTLPRPVHPYATSHRAAEDLVFAGNVSGTVRGVVLRLSNSFGAPAHLAVNRWSLLVNDLCRQAVTQQQLVLRSSGLQRRDFVSLTDVARATQHLLNLPDAQLGPGLFNLGGAWAPTIREMAMLIAERCQTVLGFAPALQAPLPGPDELSLPLDYQIDRLLATGFSLQGKHAEEIDATLALLASSQME